MLGAELQDRAGIHPQEPSRWQQDAHHLYGIGDHCSLWNAQTPVVEYSGNQGTRSTLGRRQEPGLIDQLGKLDLTTANPSTLRASYHEYWLVEQGFSYQVVFHPRKQPSNDEVEYAFPQPAKERVTDPCRDVKDESRMLPEEAIDDDRE